MDAEGGIRTPPVPPWIHHWVTKKHMHTILSDIATTLFAKHWRKSQPCTELTTRKFYLTLPSPDYEEYYDTVKDYLEVTSGMDEFLAG